MSVLRWSDQRYSSVGRGEGATRYGVATVRGRVRVVEVIDGESRELCYASSILEGKRLAQEHYERGLKVAL